MTYLGFGFCVGLVLLFTPNLNPKFIKMSVTIFHRSSCWFWENFVRFFLLGEDEQTYFLRVIGTFR